MDARIIDGRIKLRHLRCFAEIAQCGSLTGAGRALGLTQSAVSRTLAELEAILGADLMQRGRAGVALTAEGEAFLGHAGAALAALAEGIDSIGQAQMQRDATLEVGALPSVAARLMPRVAEVFAERVPQVVLSVVSGPHAHLLEGLRTGRLDLVVGRLGDPRTIAGLSFTQLYTERVAFVVRPGHPLIADPRPDRLAAWPVIFPPRDAAIRPLVERMLLAAGVGRLPRRIESVSGAFGRAVAQRSDAVWIISEGVAALDVANGTLVRLDMDTELTIGPVGLMTRAEAELAAPARHFRKTLIECAAALARPGPEGAR